MLGDERDPDACVRLNDVEHHLGANVLQQILNVVADERVIIDGAPAFTKNVQYQLSANPNDNTQQCGSLHTSEGKTNQPAETPTARLPPSTFNSSQFKDWVEF